FQRQFEEICRVRPANRQVARPANGGALQGAAAQEVARGQQGCKAVLRTPREHKQKEHLKCPK
ncbi:MAG: hypothetical protein KA790_10390, partial [Ottowia sp.]|nr:hypothetical protein [Ottowia sp.]